MAGCGLAAGVSACTCRGGSCNVTARGLRRHYYGLRFRCLRNCRRRNCRRRRLYFLWLPPVRQLSYPRNPGNSRNRGTTGGFKTGSGTLASRAFPPPGLAGALFSRAAHYGRRFFQCNISSILGSLTLGFSHSSPVISGSGFFLRLQRLFFPGRFNRGGFNA